jgi:two-component system, LytTR family, response regulator
MNIVLIDDEQSSLNHLTRLIQKIEGNIYILAAFQKTEDVLAHLKDLKPDVVFTNINMPDGIIFTTLEQLRPYTFDVVFVTAMSGFEKKAAEIGAYAYLLKPVWQDVLLPIVFELLKKHDGVL